MTFDIKALARTAKATGEQNKNRVLLWIYRWGWTTDTVLQKLLNVQRRPGCELVKRGILMRIDPPRGHKPAFIIAPGPALTRAQDLYEEATGGYAIPYAYPRTSIPFAALGEHNEIAQLIALDMLADDSLDILDLISERELRGGEQSAVPDFKISALDEYVTWHEIELHAKYKERLLLQLQEREEARRLSSFLKIVWWCRTAGIARNLAAALNADELPRVGKRPDGRIARCGGTWSPRKLAAVTEINLIFAPRGTAIPQGGQMLLEEQDPL